MAASMAILAAPDAVAQGPAGGTERSAWYVALGAGSNRSAVLDQTGHNNDNICYPTNLCPREPDGYRWTYDLESESGSVVEIAVGRTFGKLRLEVTAANLSVGIQERFTGITYLDGTAVRPAQDGNYGNSTETAVEGLSTWTFGLNAVRDFPGALDRFTPFAGIGAGVSRVELSGLHFSSEYSCLREPCAGRPAAEFNSLQTTDLTGTEWSGNLFAGVDYPLSTSGLVLGLQASYRVVGDMQDERGYQRHPIPDQTNTNRISGMNLWSLTLGIRYPLGGGT